MATPFLLLLVAVDWVVDAAPVSAHFQQNAEVVQISADLKALERMLTSDSIDPVTGKKKKVYTEHTSEDGSRKYWWDTKAMTTVYERPTDGIIKSRQPSEEQTVTDLKPKVQEEEEVESEWVEHKTLGMKARSWWTNSKTGQKTWERPANWKPKPPKVWLDMLREHREAKKPKQPEESDEVKERKQFLKEHPENVELVKQLRAKEKQLEMDYKQSLQNTVSTAAEDTASADATPLTAAQGIPTPFTAPLVATAGAPLEAEVGQATNADNTNESTNPTPA